MDPNFQPGHPRICHKKKQKNKGTQVPSVFTPETPPKAGRVSFVTPDKMPLSSLHLTSIEGAIAAVQQTWGLR